MKVSKNLYSINIDNTEQKLVFHRWYGNPLLIDNDLYFELINYNEKSSIEQEILEEWIEAGFILSEDSELTEFNSIVSKNTEQVLNGDNLERLDLIVSEMCNMGCQHCIYYAGNERHSNTSLMTYKTALKAWNEYLMIMREREKTEFELHFGGAEPLINWKLIKKVIDSFPTFLENDESISWHINTNLTILNDEIIQYFSENNFHIYTSLDGLKTTNDKHRIKLGGQGTFDVVTKNIKILQSKGCNIEEIICTITSKTIDSIDESFIDYIHELSIPLVGIDFDLVSSPSFNQDIVINKLVSLFWYCYDLGINCSGTWLTPFFHILNNDIRKEHISFCGATSGENLSVTPSGQTTLCSYMETKIGTLDNLFSLYSTNNQYSDLINSRQPGRDKHCFGCMIEAHCGGQCHITREVNVKKEGIIDVMCDFYRAVTTRMLVEYVKR